MAEPWPVTGSAEDGWFVKDDSGTSCWLDEQSARRYAALPVLIATIEDACNRADCGFCGEDDDVGHAVDCPGIAALKAAGEEVE